jgi:hypothetical protein
MTDHTSTTTMAMIAAIENALAACKGKKATVFLESLHSAGYHIQHDPARAAQIAAVQELKAAE